MRYCVGLTLLFLNLLARSGPTLVKCLLNRSAISVLVYAFHSLLFLEVEFGPWSSFLSMFQLALVLLLRDKNNQSCSFCDKSMKLSSITNPYKVNISWYGATPNLHP